MPLKKSNKQNNHHDCICVYLGVGEEKRLLCALEETVFRMECLYNRCTCTCVCKCVCVFVGRKGGREGGREGVSE